MQWRAARHLVIRARLTRRPPTATISLMVQDTGNWNSFWDLATPAEAADQLRADYGAGAADAASQCADAARADRRETDHEFWLAVLAILRGRVS